MDEKSFDVMNYIAKNDCLDGIEKIYFVAGNLLYPMCYCALLVSFNFWGNK